MINPVYFSLYPTLLGFQDAENKETPRRIAFIINGDESSKIADIHQNNVEQAVARLKAEGFDGIHVLAPKEPAGKVQYYGKPTLANL